MLFPPSDRARHRRVAHAVLPVCAASIVMLLVAVWLIHVYGASQSGIRSGPVLGSSPPAEATVVVSGGAQSKATLTATSAPASSPTPVPISTVGTSSSTPSAPLEVPTPTTPANIVGSSRHNEPPLKCEACGVIPDQATLGGPTANAELTSFPLPASADNQESDDAHFMQFEVKLNVNDALNWYKSQLGASGYTLVAPSGFPEVFPARTLNFTTPAQSGASGRPGSLLVTASPSQPDQSIVLVVIR